MECILIFTSQNAMDVNGATLPWALDELQVQPIRVTPEKHFLIAYDAITDPAIVTDALQNIPVKMLYVMHHRKPEQPVLAALKKALDALKIPYEYPFFQSEHSDKNNYTKVPDIGGLLNNKQQQQLEQLFDDLQIQLSGDKVLEDKLKILHFLLTADTRAATDKKKLDELIEKANKEIIAAVADFKSKSNSHFDRLTALRDQLLSEY